MAAASVLQGAGIDGAVGYSGGPPHPILIVQSNGDPHPSCQVLPAEWEPLTATDSQLVAVIGDEEEVVMERCSYQNGPDVVRYRYTLPVRLLQAVDGVEVARTSLGGALPRSCGQTEQQQLTRLSGEPVNDAQVIDWLARYATVVFVGWSRVPLEEPNSDSTMTGVVSGGPGLVAVGWDESGGDADAAVWTSPDGLVWSRVPHDEATFGGPGWQGMDAVVAGGPGLVAVGRDEAGETAVVWTSPDGLVWSQAFLDDAAYGSSMRGVVAGGPGLVAVGTDGLGAASAVWTSPDGLVWSRVPHDPAIFDGDFESSEVMEAVTVGGPGLVAVGWESGGERNAVVWTSPDGLVWSRVPHGGATFGGSGAQSMSSVAAGGPGLVAVGFDRSGGSLKAAVWTSPDGLVWSRVPRVEPIFDSDFDSSLVMEAVTVGDAGLVAVGGAVWTSPDGLTWSRMPRDTEILDSASGQGMRAVVAGGPGLVAVGSDARGAGAAVWVSSTPG